MKLVNGTMSIEPGINYKPLKLFKDFLPVPVTRLKPRVNEKGSKH